MNSESFQEYKHSGKSGVQGPILALIAAVVSGIPLGIAYAYVVSSIPTVHFNFFATVGYGFCMGIIASLLLKTGKVRHNGIAGITGFLVGLIALYCAWNGYLFTLSESKRWLWRPDQIIRAMEYFYEHGSWGVRSEGRFRGVILAIVWLVEAGIIVGFAMWAATRTIARTPFCEMNQCWLDKQKKINSLERFTDPEQLAAFKAGDLAPLAKAKPKMPGASTFTRLILKYSPKCDIFCTVQIKEITTKLGKNGGAKETVKDLSNDLMLPHSMFELITKFENFKPAEVAVPTAPPPVPI